jgi:tetratricopeptide (TPR) repeat protein
MSTNSANMSTPGASDDVAKIAVLQTTANNAIQNGQIPVAVGCYEQLLALKPTNPDILGTLGVLWYQAGNKDRALSLLCQAFELAPRDPTIRKNYSNMHIGAARDHMAQGRLSEAVACFRIPLSLAPEDADLRVDFTNALELSGEKAVLNDFMAGVTPDQLGTHLLVACMPKSGSTLLKECLRGLTGWQEAMLSYAYLQNEQEIFLPNLLKVALENTITQQHCRATGPNVQILQAFGIRPVVLIRHLPDIVLSMSDFYDQGAITNTFFSEAWPTLDQTGKYDLVIDHVMPWYAAFYASWEATARLGKLDCLMVSYEEMIADKPATLHRVSEFLGINKTLNDCKAVIENIEGDAQKTRMNKGVTGRGAAALNDDQKSRLRRLVKTYGSLDLERVGLA